MAPQLTNTGPWQASPILVSGGFSYRSGEFVYQDFLYDDHGARGKSDPGDARSGGNGFSAPNGTYTYPTGSGYAGDAADLVELRIRPAKTATLFRLTFTIPHSYWLSGLRLRAGAKLGNVDVVSRGFGRGDSVASPTRHGSGTLKGLLGRLTFASQSRASGTAPKRAVTDRLVIHATGIAALTIDGARARVSCHPKLTVHADGPLRVNIVDCGKR